MGPYTFTADFLNEDAFNSGYALRFSLSPGGVRACPLPSSASQVIEAGATSLLETGEYVRPSNVSAGQCRTYKLEILNPLGHVVDMQYVFIDNI